MASSPSSSSSSLTAGNSRTGNGRYLLCIEGLPIEYSWKDLKDLVRKKATHGIWTDVVPTQPYSGQNVGVARVQRKDEAENLYRYLTETVIEAQPFVVHLWDISGHTLAKFMRCNCSRSSRHPSSVDMARTSPATWGCTAAMPATSLVLRVDNYMMQPPPVPVLNANQVVYPNSMPSRYQHNPPDLTSYMFNITFDPYVASHGINAGQGLYHPMAAAPMTPNSRSHAFGSSSRGPGGLVPAGRHEERATVRSPLPSSQVVMVSKINHRAQREDIKRLFQAAGPITQIWPRTFSRSRSFKIAATIEYATADAARTAVGRFHGMRFMEMELGVRLANEPAANRMPATAVAGVRQQQQQQQEQHEHEQEREQEQLPWPESELDVPTIVNGSRSQ